MEPATRPHHCRTHTWKQVLGHCGGSAESRSVRCLSITSSVTSPELRMVKGFERFTHSLFLFLIPHSLYFLSPCFFSLFLSLSLFFSLSLLPSLPRVPPPEKLVAYQREFHALKERLRVAEHRTLQRSSELNSILEQFRRAIAETNGSKDALNNFSGTAVHTHILPRAHTLPSAHTRPRAHTLTHTRTLTRTYCHAHTH